MARKLYPDFPYTEFQLQWLKVLEGRDRKFKPSQTTGALKSNENGGFCCLGVACQIASDMGLTDIEWVLDYDDDQYEGGVLVEDACPNDSVFFDGSTEILSEAMRDKLNFHSTAGDANDLVSEPDLDDYTHRYSPPQLAESNDNGYSFATIAKLIRMFPHCYFSNGGDPDPKVYRKMYFDLDFEITHFLGV